MESEVRRGSKEVLDHLKVLYYTETIPGLCTSAKKGALYREDQISEQEVNRILNLDGKDKRIITMNEAQWETVFCAPAQGQE